MHTVTIIIYRHLFMLYIQKSKLHYFHQNLCTLICAYKMGTYAYSYHYHLQASVYVMHTEIQITLFSPEFMYLDMCIQNGHICIQLYTREHCQHVQLAGFKLFTLNLKIKTITNRRILIELIRGAIPLPFTNPSISLYKLAMSVAY